MVISEIYVEHAIEGYRCRALVSVDGATWGIFLRLIPPDTYFQIESHLGCFGVKEVQLLFEKRIRQFIESRRLGSFPASAGPVGIRALENQEVDGLFC